MAGWLLDGIVAWLMSFTTGALNQLWGLLSHTVFTTLDVTAAPQVVAIARRALAIVDVGFVLAIITAGITVMTRDTLQIRYGVAELVPRLVVAFIAAHFSQPICRQAIELANALTQAITGEPVASAGTFAHLLRVITQALNSPGNVLLLVIIGMLIGVLTAMLLVSWLVRLVVLVVLVGIAPAALACHASPYTDGAARLWWRALLGCLGVVVLQALSLHTTVSVFLDPSANLGLPQDRSGMFNLFIVACLLWVTVRIPGLVRRYVTHTGGRNMGGYLIRVVLVHQLTRIIGRGLGRGTRAGRGRDARPGPAGPAGQAVVPYWRPRRSGQPASAPTSPPSAARPARQAPAGRTAPTRRMAAPPGAAMGAAPPAAGQQPARPPGVRPPGGIPPLRPVWRAAPGARRSGTGWPDPPTRPARTLGATPSGVGWPSAAHADSRYHPPRRRGQGETGGPGRPGGGSGER